MVFRAPDGRVLHGEAQFFKDFYSEQNTLEFPQGWSVLSSNGNFVPLLRSWRRMETSSVLHFESTGYDIRLTDNHIVPVIRDGQCIEVYASEIQIGDRFIGGIQPETNVFRHTVLNIFDLIGPSHEFWLSPESAKAFRWRLHEIGKTSEFLEKYPYGSDYHVDFAMYYEYRRIVAMDESQITVRCLRGRHDYSAIIPLTYELGRLIGYLYSEGSIASDRVGVTWTNADPIILNDVRSLLRMVFPNNPVTESVNSWGTTCLTISSVFWNYLFKYRLSCKTNSGAMRLPMWYADANFAFLQGVIGALMDGDGSISESSCVYSTACEGFAKDLKRVLLTLNIFAKLTKSKCRGTAATFGNVTVERNFDVYYLRFPRSMLVGANIGSIILQRSLQHWPGDHRIRDRSVIRRITREVYNDYVYDFETGDHYFYADGVIVHNCCSLPLGKLLHNGFANGHGALRTPATISSATTLMCIIIQANQNQMFK